MKRKKSKRMMTVAMANSLGGLNVPILAEDVMDTIRPLLAPITAFTTDFSHEIRDGGESVTAAIPGIMVIGDTSNGFTAQDYNSTGVQVFLNRSRGGAIKITVDDMAKMKGDPTWVMDKLIKPSIEPLAEECLQHLMSQFTAAHFNAPTNTMAVPLVSWNASKVVGARKQMNKNKASKSGRVLIYNEDYAEPLLNEDKFLRAVKGGNEKLAFKGILEEAYGFGLLEMAVPTAGNLVGVAATPAACAFAARTLRKPEATHAVYENVNEPQSGFPLQLGLWWEPKDKAYWFSLDAVYGAAPGLRPAAVRITFA